MQVQEEGLCTGRSNHHWADALLPDWPRVLQNAERKIGCGYVGVSAHAGLSGL